MPKDPKNIKALYDVASKDYDLGTFDDFSKKLDDPANRQALFKTIGEEYDLGDYSTFNKRLGFDSEEVKQKNQPSFLTTPEKQLTEATTIKEQPQQPQIEDNQNDQFLNIGEPVVPKHKATAPPPIKPKPDLSRPDIKEAIDNAVIEKNKAFKVKEDEYDMNFGRDEIIEAYKDGDLVPQKDAQGKSVMKRGVGMFESFVNAINEEHYKSLDNQAVMNTPKDELIKQLNLERENPEIFHKASNEAPSGVGGEIGNFVGENLGLILKGTTGAVAGAASGATGGESFGTFLAMSKDLANAGYAETLKKNYNLLKEQQPDISDEEAFDKASKAALAGEAISLGTGAILSGSLKPKVPLPNVPITGVLNGIEQSLGHAVSTAPKVVGSAAVGSLLNDVASEAIGVDVKFNDAMKNATESAKAMAVMHFGLWALTEPKRVPSYIRPQVENIVASAPREEVQNFYLKAEEAGALPEGTTQEVMSKLSEFDQAKAVTAPLRVSEEKRAAIADKIIQRNKLMQEQATLDPAFKTRAAEIESELTGINKEIDEMYKAKNVWELERDNLTGDKPSVTVITPEELKDTQKETTTIGVEETPPETQKSGVSVILPESNKSPEIVENVKEETQTEKPTVENIETSGSNTEPIPAEESGNREAAMGEVVQPTREEPPTPEIPKIEVLNDGEGNIYTHAGTAVKREALGLPERTPTETKKSEELNAEADAYIKDGKFNVEKLDAKANDGKAFEDVERVAYHKYAANLDNKLAEDVNSGALDINSPDFDVRLKEVEKAYDTLEKAGTNAGRSLQAIQNSAVPDDTLAGFFIEQKKASVVDELTEKQKTVNQKEFEEISAAKKEYEEKLAKSEAENAKLRAEKEFAKTKSTSKKSPKKDYATEREKIIGDIREKLRKARGDTQATIVPYAKELIAIAPDVAKLAKNLIDNGIEKLEDVVRAIHATLKDDIEGITEKDVHNILAGDYVQRKETKNELTAKLLDLKTEASLINQLEKLEAGEKPKSNKAQENRNKRLKELRDKIKEHDLTKIARIKARTETEIAKIQEQLKTGDFQKTEKPKVPLDKETLAAKDKLIKLRQEREVRILKDKYANRTKLQKGIDIAANVLNVPRSIMSSMDFSAPLRQGLVLSIDNPKLAAKAFGTMFKHAFSQKAYDRFFYDIQDTPRYKTAEESGLYVANPHDPLLSAREEQFMTNLSQKIPVLGKLVKGSERAYTSYLNKLRWDAFNKYVDAFEAEGKTIENSPELYKAQADLVNAMTGRGNLGKTLEMAAPILNATFFSPRLIASRLQLMNPYFYAKLPKEVRVNGLKSMAKFVGAIATTLALAKAAGADVETDLRSSDAGKIKVGNTRYDIMGGFQQYLRFFYSFYKGQTKSPSTGEIRDFGSGYGETSRKDLVERFFRGKLAPVPSAIWDFTEGKTILGDRTSLSDEAKRSLLPLIYSDVQSAFKDKGVSSIFTTGIPAAFGVGVQTYEPTDVKDAKTADWNEVYKDAINSKELNAGATLFIKDPTSREERKMTKDELAIFQTKRDEIIKKELDKLKEKGIEEFKNVSKDPKRVSVKKVVTPSDKITVAQMRDELRRIKGAATTEAKNELFPETAKEKVVEGIIEGLNQDLNLKNK